jgi:hypothetical protein
MSNAMCGVFGSEATLKRVSGEKIEKLRGCRELLL